MKKLIPMLILILSVASNAQSRLTNDDVIAMVKSGLSPEIIAAKVRTADSAFDVSTEGLKKLSEAKVPDSVVVSMIEREGSERQTIKSEIKETKDASNLFPEQGTLSDIKGKSKVYILTSDLKARDKIAKELEKKKLFQVVDSVEDSDFVMKFESWIETVGVVANVYGNTATAQPRQVNIGVLTVIMPSVKSDRPRLVYSKRNTQKFRWSDHPAESTAKDFVKDFVKLP